MARLVREETYGNGQSPRLIASMITRMISGASWVAVGATCSRYYQHRTVLWGLPLHFRATSLAFASREQFLSRMP